MNSNTEGLEELICDSTPIGMKELSKEDNPKLLEWVSKFGSRDKFKDIGKSKETVKEKIS